MRTNIDLSETKLIAVTLRGANLSGYTSREISNLLHALGITPKEISLDRVRKIAQHRKWGIIKIGRSNIYIEADVKPYIDARLRYGLMKKMGWLSLEERHPQHPHEIRRDDWDLPACPVKDCPALAITNPSSGGEWACSAEHHGNKRREV